LGALAFVAAINAHSHECDVISADMTLPNEFSLMGKRLFFVGVTPKISYRTGAPKVVVTGYSEVPTVMMDDNTVNISTQECMSTNGMQGTNTSSSSSTTSETTAAADSQVEDDASKARCHQAWSLGQIVAGLTMAATSSHSAGTFAGLCLAALSATPGVCADGHGAGDHCEAVVEVTVYTPQGPRIGETTARIPEAGKSSYPDNCLDGMDGDVDFPHGNLKPIATVGECLLGSDFCMVGVPDGLGAMLADDQTVRMIGQSESYGHITGWESMPYKVNNGAANFTGSHVMYVDYDRTMMAGFLAGDYPAADMVTGAGSIVETVYNLKGEQVMARNRAGATTEGAHFSSTDAAGNWAMQGEPVATKADWVMMSLCSAHLEQKHQWGEGIGVEDDLFITNEEWTSYLADTDFVGLSSHAIDIANKAMYAVGAFTNGGFEKSVEINTGTTQYVAFANSGYNGAFGSAAKPHGLMMRNMSHGLRDDGMEYVWPQDIVPSRVYIGLKGYNAQGQPDTTSFLARNGLAYGKVYGFAVSATDFTARDTWHREHYNGDTVDGGFYPTAWMWDGTVQNFEHDGSWEFQNTPVNGEGMQFWTAGGKDAAGFKTEHVSPDPHGASAFYQGSTAGYVGKYAFPALQAALEAVAGTQNPFPDSFDATYHLLQGETDINELINLGGKGETDSAIGDQSYMCDSSACKATFEDCDGMEALASGEDTYVVIQEDGGNRWGERMFITKVDFERGQSMDNKVFDFVAMSGGAENSRFTFPCAVGIPSGSWSYNAAHEFSGIFDISGLIATDSDGNFELSASDTGARKRALDKMVPIGEKSVIIALQAHGYSAGAVKAHLGDRGGQWLLYRPAPSM